MKIALHGHQTNQQTRQRVTKRSQKVVSKGCARVFLLNCCCLLWFPFVFFVKRHIEGLQNAFKRPFERPFKKPLKDLSKGLFKKACKRSSKGVKRPVKSLSMWQVEAKPAPHIRAWNGSSIHTELTIDICSWGSEALKRPFNRCFIGL